jgi:hypothetical protein
LDVEASFKQNAPMAEQERKGITATDAQIVAWQIGREPRSLNGIAVRCPYGFPAVTFQAATDEDGNPFPTGCYLTCPHLVTQIDRVEAAGGVKRWEAVMAGDPELRAATDAAHDRHRLLDDREADIAGLGNRERLKCLHAHAAFALADGNHPLGATVVREASPRWCDDAHCMGALMDTHTP